MGKRLRSRGKKQDANGKIQMIRSNGTKKVIGKRDTEQKQWDGKKATGKR